jgi:hypothetical protein
MSIYQYDFQSCGHAIIDEVRAVVDSQREWDFSASGKQARVNSLAAERRFGIKRPRSAEQRALTKYLIDSRAGLHIATYAWGIYVDLKASMIVGDLVAT